MPSTSRGQDDDAGEDADTASAVDSLRPSLERDPSRESVPSCSGKGEASKIKRTKKSGPVPTGSSDVAKVLSDFLASVSIHYIFMTQHYILIFW